MGVHNCHQFPKELWVLTANRPTTCIRISAQFEDRCRQIADTYGLPAVDNFDDVNFTYGLEFGQGILKLLELGSRQQKPIFLSTGMLGTLPRKNLLGRAIGRKVKSILDATAGLGTDALLLARMGFKVTAIERCAVFAALLEDAVARAVSTSGQIDLEYRFGDARLILAESAEPPDVIYLDPMYPEGRKRSVKVARPLVVLRDVVGDDADFEGLLRTAIATAGKRVVVKRPKFSQSLCQEHLSMRLQGKLVRYDIYLCDQSKRDSLDDCL